MFISLNWRDTNVEINNLYLSTLEIFISVDEATFSLVYRHQFFGFFAYHTCVGEVQFAYLFPTLFQQMRSIRNWLAQTQTHEGMSMVAFNIITHGTRDGWLRSADDQGDGLHVHDIMGTLSDVESLRGKPKLLFVNACRGSKYMYYRLFHRI